MLNRRNILASGALALALTGVGFNAAAQESVKVTKPMSVIVPFSPGALIDIIARVYADELSKRIGQPVVVENRPGAGAMVGTQRMLAEDPSRNTMLFISSALAVMPSVQKDLSFDPRKDLSGISLIASSPTLVVVNAKSPYKDVKALVDAAKKSDAHLTYGSAGINSGTDLAGRYFNQEAGVKLQHIPYKGVQEAVAEVVAGRIDVAYPPIGLALPFLKSGQLRALAVTSSKRSDFMPDVPTVAEQGIPGFDYTVWYSVVMNAKTDPNMKRYIAKQISDINQDPAVRKQLEQQGLVPEKLLLKDFDKYIAAEIDKYDRIMEPGS
jgi:tripartite-type tricarboxylate transporter receptor subunit TctC